MTVGQDKPALDALAHFGVKGMKWGVRTAEPINPGYSSRKQAIDERSHGKRGVKRIDARMNRGESRDRAQRLEQRRNRRQRLVVVGSAVAARILLQDRGLSIGNISANIADRANRNRQAAQAAGKLISIGAKAAKLAFAKSKDGAFIITTMK